RASQAFDCTGGLPRVPRSRAPADLAGWLGGNSRLRQRLARAASSEIDLKGRDDRMKAIRIHGRGGADHLVYEEAPQPQPGPGEALIYVGAIGVIANELKWDLTYQTPTSEPRPHPIPGRDVSGVVTAVGSGVTEVAVGEAVYALLAFGRDGA